MAVTVPPASVAVELFAAEGKLVGVFVVAGNGFPGPGHLGLLTLGSQFDLELLLQ